METTKVWERAPYDSSGAELLDICDPASAKTTRLYVKRKYKGSQSWEAFIQGRRIKGTFGSAETAKAAVIAALSQGGRK